MSRGYARVMGYDVGRYWYAVLLSVSEAGFCYEIGRRCQDLLVQYDARARHTVLGGPAASPNPVAEPKPRYW